MHLTPEFRKVLAFRGLQVGTLAFGCVLIVTGVAFGFPSRSNLYVAATAALCGALVIALGLRGIDVLGSRNRARYDSHLSTVAAQISLLAGSSGRRQGLVASDWGNARWRDLGEGGRIASYSRLPLLVPTEDVVWPIFNATNTTTGVPIDEIAGMDLAVEHLQFGRGDMKDLIDDARRCLGIWREFDARFQTCLLETTRQVFGASPRELTVGWEEIPWFEAVEDQWRLLGRGFVLLTMAGEPPHDRPKFHLPGRGDSRWDVRVGDSSIWLMIGGAPFPDESIEQRVTEVVTRLRSDSALRDAFRAATETTDGLREKANTVRRELHTVPFQNQACRFCTAIWILSPPR